MKPHPYDLNEEHEEAFTFQRPDPVDEKTRAEDDAAREKPIKPIKATGASNRPPQRTPNRL